MIAWLYTEAGQITRDGPFVSLDEVMSSRLWQWPSVCVWLEEETSHGWAYENVRWTGDAWVTTSRGLRPAEIIRPSFLLEARPA